jgi:glycerol-3-phosphate dehydrogenase (NAD(P)+)
MNPISTIGVLGGGAWGTALAQVAATAGRAVTLWAFEPDVVAAINEDHENKVFLPGLPLLPSIRATSELGDLAHLDTVLAVVPAQHLRSILVRFAPMMRDSMPIILCAKGVEQGSLALMTEVLAQSAPRAIPAVLSGPSFALDVAQGMPTAITLACADAAIGTALVKALGLPTFRPYLSDDLVGAEIGGAVKNVLAIACGIVEGLALGESARAALITRGFAEMTRLARALGGRTETVAGLCGLGDLILTCSSRTSRNFSLGLALASGLSLADALASKKSVAEGAASAPAVVALAGNLGVGMPICEAVAALLAGQIDVASAVQGLLARPFRGEHG